MISGMHRHRQLVRTALGHTIGTDSIFTKFGCLLLRQMDHVGFDVP